MRYSILRPSLSSHPPAKSVERQEKLQENEGLQLFLSPMGLSAGSWEGGGGGAGSTIHAGSREGRRRW